MKINIDELADTLGLPTWEKWSEDFSYEDTYHEAYKAAKGQALHDGESEEDAEAAGETAGQEAEQEQEGEEFRSYYDNLMHVAEEVFNHHGLQLVPSDDPGSGPHWKMAADLDGVRKRRRR